MNLGWFKDMKRFLKIKKTRTSQEIGRQLFGPGTNWWSKYVFNTLIQDSLPRAPSSIQVSEKKISFFRWWEKWSGSIKNDHDHRSSNLWFKKKTEKLTARWFSPKNHPIVTQLKRKIVQKKQTSIYGFHLNCPRCTPNSGTAIQNDSKLPLLGQNSSWFFLGPGKKDWDAARKVEESKSLPEMLRFEILICPKTQLYSWWFRTLWK